MKPSDFLDNPMGSVKNKSEYETIARNIMVILSKTGDIFRKLSWVEYYTFRLKDDKKHNINEEKKYFEEVVNYCESEKTARLFSPIWKSIK